MEQRDSILSGKTALGMEFGSTRIKGVLIDLDGNVLAVGIHDWENSFVNNIWTYSLEEIHTGLRNCYRSLREEVEKKYGITLQKIGSIGISAMSHANNGTSDLNARVGLFGEFAELMGYHEDKGELFTKLYTNSLKGDPDCCGLLAYGYYSGENITMLNEGRLAFLRTPDSHFNGNRKSESRTNYGTRRIF